MLPSTSGVSGGRLQPGHSAWRPRRSAAPCCSSAAGGGPSNSSSGGSSTSSSTSSSGSSSTTGGGASWLQQQLSAAGRRAGAALLAAALAAAPLAPLALPPPPPAAAVTNEQLLFLEAWRAVDRAYVDKSFNGQSWFRMRERYLKEQPMANQEQTYAAIRTLLATLGDPFTRFLDPDQYAALRSTTSGSVTGVGVEVGFDTAAGADGPLVVVAPAAGGPAERAGIKPRDQILAIDGQPTNALSLYAAASLLQGPSGSSVALTVRSMGEAGQGRELVLQREPIKINPVEYTLCSSSGRAAPQAPEAKLGYIRVSSFAKPTAQGVRDAIDTLQAQGAEGYVLDIRSNGGGLFPAGVEVARMWINRGELVLIADSDGIRDVYEADNTALEPRAPLAVLVNRGTASAAEVLAGALKDNGRAVIAGENTFGKGVIQTLVPLSDGSALAVTVAKYQTPAGVDINKVGIAPQLVLDAAALAEVPTSGLAFCKYVQSAETAPPLLGAAQKR